VEDGESEDGEAEQAEEAFADEEAGGGDNDGEEGPGDGEEIAVAAVPNLQGREKEEIESAKDEEDVAPGGREWDAQRQAGYLRQGEEGEHGQGGDETEVVAGEGAEEEDAVEEEGETDEVQPGFRLPAQDGDAEGQQGGGVVSLQLGLTTLRLQHTPTPTAPAFLSRLAGRASARVNAPVPGAVLNEGMGRLLALLDVLENYPGRGMAAAAPTMTDAPEPAASAMHAMATMDTMDALDTIDATPQLAAAGE